MTPPDVLALCDELERLAKEATPGLWLAASKPSSIVGWPVVNQFGRSVCSLNYVQHTRIDRNVPGDQAFNAESRANGELIALMRNNILTLISAAREKVKK